MKYKVTQEQWNEIQEISKHNWETKKEIFTFLNGDVLEKDRDNEYSLYDAGGFGIEVDNKMYHKNIEDMFEVTDVVDMTNSELEAKLEREEHANKDKKGKLDWSLLDMNLLEEVVEVFEQGAIEYGRWNYRKGHSYSDIYSAIWRHIKAWYWNKQDIDLKSGKHHLSHVIANCMMLLHTIKHCSKDFDDRT